MLTLASPPPSPLFDPPHHPQLAWLRGCSPFIDALNEAELMALLPCFTVRGDFYVCVKQELFRSVINGA